MGPETILTEPALSRDPKCPDPPTSSSSEHEFEFDAASEKRLVRKLDQRLVLVAFLCYLTAMLDRSNIGNAETAGMSEDLGMSDAQYQWLLTIFYIPYILFEWLALMWKIFPPHIWASACILTWAIASMLQATASNWRGLMACRWFLAMAESGFGPGMPYLFSFFYTRRELGVRCGFFVSAAPLATTFAGALAYGITSGRYAIAGWRLLFIIEAVPPLVMSAVVFFVLPDSAASATFLTEEERSVARARALAATGRESGTVQRRGVGTIEPREVLGALRTPQAWVQAAMYFSCNVAFASLPVFLPAILAGMGFESVNAQGLTAPPYFLAFCVCILSTWAGGRARHIRGFLIGGLSLLGCAGYVMLAASESVSVRYAGVFLAASGVFAAIANTLSWLLNNQRSDTKRGVGIAVMNIIGQCGSLLGTRIFPKKEGPYYTKGMIVCAGFMFLSAVLAFGLRAYFKYWNDQWDREVSRSWATSTGAVGEKREGGKTSAAENMSEAAADAAAAAAETDEARGWENSAAWRYAL